VPVFGSSHPWAAGPAAIIVRRLFGVRALDVGYSTVAVHPQLPGPKHLSNGSVVVPTVRGSIAVAFQQSTQTGLVLQLTVPRSMLAEVCLPTALLLHGAATHVLRVNGKDVASVLRQPGQRCVAAKLGGGHYTVGTGGSEA
jgi:hypothetical protein